MRDVEKLKVEYIGYSNPVTEDEVILEILGLELAVKCAEQRISLLKQGVKLGEMKQKEALEAQVIANNATNKAKWEEEEARAKAQSKTEEVSEEQ